jgi:hypothetical protein
VTPAHATRTSKGLALDVAFPQAPGLYRLVATLHTKEGVAYDAATQALLTPVLVRVRPSVAAAYGVQPSLATTEGAKTQLAVRVLNAGTTRWDLEVAAPQTRVADERGVVSRTTTLRANLVATWVSASGDPVPAAVSQRLEDVLMAPGGSTQVDLPLTVPTTPGEYLLLIDVVSPSSGALSSLGSQPAIVRVTVAPPAPAATPEPAATPAPETSSTPDATSTPQGSGAPGASPAAGSGHPDKPEGGPKRPD